MFRQMGTKFRRLFVRRNRTIRKSDSFFRSPIEVFEDRIVPATTNWVGTTGIWDQASNWDNGIPTAADIAVINPSSTSTISAAGTDVALQVVTGAKSTLLVKGTLTLGSGSSVFGGPVLMNNGGTLSVSTGASLLINNGVLVTVASGGTLNVTSPASFQIDDHSTSYPGNADGIVVNGSMNVTNATLGYKTASGASTNDSISSIQIKPNGKLTALNSTFGWDVLSMDTGSTLVDANQIKNNILNTTLYIPALDVPLLANNTSFQDINLNSQSAFGTGASPVLDLVPMGSNSAQRYIIPGLTGFNGTASAFEIPTNATLNVDAGSSLLIDNGVFIDVDTGAILNVTSPASFKIDDQSVSYPGNADGIVVNGSMIVSGTTFGYLNSSGASTNDSISSVQVKSGGHFTLANSTFGWDDLGLDSGSVQSAGEIHDDVFNTTMYIPASDIPLLASAAAKNLSFQDINLNSGATTFGTLSVVDLAPMGPNSAIQRFVFPGITGFGGTAAAFAIPTGVTLNIDSGAVVLIDSGALISVTGALNVTDPSSVNVDDHNVSYPGNSDGIEVKSKGTMTSTNGVYSYQDGNSSDNTNSSVSSIQIDAGGSFDFIGGFFGWDRMLLNAGSTDRMQYAFPETQLTISSTATLTVNQNDFTDAAVVASGSTGTHINLIGNYWGTVNVTQIENHITDVHDNSGLPTVDFDVPLSARPAEPVGASATTVYSGGPHAVTLTATVTTPSGSGSILVKEGQITFTIISSTNVTIGTPVTVNIDTTTGVASANYSLPAGISGGTYTIQVSFQDSGSTYESNIDSSHTLFIDSVATVSSSVDPSPVTIGSGSASVSLGATITSSAGTVLDGTVIFKIFNSLSVMIGSATASVSGGAAVAPFTIPAGTPGGLYGIEVDYSEASNLNFKTSTNLGSLGTLTVNQAPTITTTPNTSFVAGTNGTFNVLASGYPTQMTYSVLSGTLPTGITLNSTSGVLSGTVLTTDPTQFGVFTFSIKAANTISSTTQTFTLTIDAAPTITTAPNTTFVVGTNGTFNIASSGFPTLTTYSVIGGTLPTGITLSSSGVLSGTVLNTDPTQFGVFTFTIQATNSTASTTQTFTLTIKAAPTIVSANNAAFTRGTAGTFTVTATGYPAPTLSVGSLPSGVSFDTTTDILSVSAAAGNGVSTITFTATNALGVPSQTFTLTIGSSPSISTGNTKAFLLGVNDSFQALASGFPSPIFSEIGTLPAGVTLSSTGLLHGTPLESGSFPIILTATNALDHFDQSFTIVVNDPPLISTQNNDTFYTSATNHFAVSASGFPKPTYTTPGPLPAGVTLDLNTGVLGGIPTSSGPFDFVITASNGIGTPSTQNYHLDVQVGVPPLISSPNAISFAASTFTSFSVVSAGNPLPAFSETGTLPTGVALDPVTGALSGTPTVSGVFPITITATNLLGSNPQPFTLTVTAPPAIQSTNSSTLLLGGSVNFQVAATGYPAPSYSFTGTLPNGVTLSPSGLLSGIPTVSGSFPISIKGTNAFGSDVQSFTLTVNAPPLITSLNTTKLVIDTSGSFQVAASGFPASTFTETGLLPVGVTLSPSGLLSGLSSVANNFAITIFADNGIGTPASQSFTLVVVPPVVVSPQLAIPDGQVALAYNQSITAGGPVGPYTFTIISGALPSGLSLTPGGVLNGSPTVSGAFSFTVKALNGTSDSGTHTYTLNIAPSPVPLTISGLPNGDTATYLPNSSGKFILSAVVASPAFTSSATRTAVADVNGDGVPDTIEVTGPGLPIRVSVINGADHSIMILPFDPFGGDFTGGGFVAAADLDGDGRAEFIVTPDQGGGPRVSIYSLHGVDPILRANYYTVDSNFRGGARVAVGDVNHDGVPDLAVVAGYGGGPRVALINGKKIFSTDGFNPADRLVSDFFAFDSSLRNGVYIAIGDVDGDGYGDLIFGAGPGGGPEVLTISGKTLLTSGAVKALASPISNFFVGNSDSDRSGVRVAVINADQDGKADLAVGSGAGEPGQIRVYLGKNIHGSGEPSNFQDLDLFQGATLDDGVYVG